MNVRSALGIGGLLGLLATGCAVERVHVLGKPAYSPSSARASSKPFVPSYYPAPFVVRIPGTPFEQTLVELSPYTSSTDYSSALTLPERSERPGFEFLRIEFRK